jgi:hypothetical protein
MTEPGDGRISPEADGPPPAPRWVKVAAIVATIVLLAFLVTHLLGGGLGHMARH